MFCRVLCQTGSVAYTYRTPDRDQLILLPASIKEWLPEDHEVWTVLEVVSLLDLSRFHARHPNDGVGRRAYDPAMMLALLLYGYCIGLRSSRRIAQACRTDLGFKVICVDVVPEHDAIGRFRADHETAIGELFTQVLLICYRAGIFTLGTIALDGTKIAADAALDQNRLEAAIRCEVDEILAQAGDADADTTDDRGHWSGPGSRLPRLRAALAQIEAERATADQQTRQHAQRVADDVAGGRRPRGRLPLDPALAVLVCQGDVHVCRQRLEQATTMLARLHGVNELAAAEQRLAGAQATLAVNPAVPVTYQANTTDPDSRIMKTRAGWVQGYNAQAAVTDTQIIVAADVTQDHNDVAQFIPMLALLGENLHATAITEPVGVVLADAGYWSEPNATSQGPDRLIATTKDYKQRRAAREMGATQGLPPEGLNTLEQMEHRLRTPEGTKAYTQRSSLIEPVFGNIKTNRHITGFLRRGINAVRSEWSLICTTNNIRKYATYRNNTRPATT